MSLKNQAKGTCGHIKASWDSHERCRSCCKCSFADRCEVSALWPAGVWTQVSLSRLHSSRKSRKDRENRSLSLAPSDSSVAPASPGAPQATDPPVPRKSVGKSGVTGQDAPVAGATTGAQTPGSAVEVFSTTDSTRGSAGSRTGPSTSSETRHSASRGGQASSRTSGSPSHGREVGRTGKHVSADDRARSYPRGKRSPTPRSPVRHVVGSGGWCRS